MVFCLLDHALQARSARLLKSGDGGMSPYPGQTYPTKRGAPVENGNADLERGDLAIKVPRGQTLAQHFRTVHLCFDAAPAVVAAPSAIDGAQPNRARPLGSFVALPANAIKDRRIVPGKPAQG
jgi:hypothetical protein